jgi:hypothetical protein
LSAHREVGLATPEQADPAQDRQPGVARIRYRQLHEPIDGPHRAFPQRRDAGPGQPRAGQGRRDGIVIGNLMDRGNWTLEPDEDVRRQNVEAAMRFFAAMRPPARGAQLTRSERPQTSPGLESFFGEES